ncbi:MAG: hypothetical protein QOE74_5732, partial [Mycobacterium sp.]|nr:hypothetical protein [Mycobacterium sp.]
MLLGVEAGTLGTRALVEHGGGGPVDVL